MRLFKSNKSQASLQNSQEGRSQSQSQEQSPVEPALAPQHAHHGRGGQAQARIQTDGNDPPPYQQGSQYQRYDEAYAQPAHLPGRSQSHRISPTTYSNPTVKLVAPSQGGFNQATIDEAEQQQQVYPSPPLNNSGEGEHLPEVPKSKRGFFGLSSSLAKDHKSSASAAPPPGPPQKLGRSISVRRKGPEPHQNPQRFSVQDPSTEIRPLREESEDLQQEFPLPLNPRNPAHLVSPGLYQQPQQELSQDQLSLNRVNTDPSIQQIQADQHRSDGGSQPAQVASHHPAHYQEDIQQPTPQHPQYQAFQPPPANPPNAYNPYPQPQPLNLQPKFNPPPDRFRPPSQQSLGPPSPLSTQTSFELQRHTQDNRNSLQTFPPPTSQSLGQMAPNAQNAPLRGMNMNQQNQQAPPPRSDSIRDQEHNHGGQYGQGPGPPQSGNRHLQQGPPDQGRNSPQPMKLRGDSGDVDVGSLLQKHDDLMAKYSKVKKYYFEKDAQVQQLQNTLAHQRLSLSRTSLDDNEYSTRFNRLDGAINNLAFNIRKEWKAIPPWLQSVVNRDAVVVGTKEMTAVGRACITRWLVDEILDRYFHPGLEPTLSSQLKIIEKNVRRFSPPANTDEEKDAILAKLSNWRLTTLDGLQDILSSPQSTEYRTNLTQMLVDKLTASLQMNLKDPPPVGLEGGVTMIVELAVGIAANLPQESRDVSFEYFLPGALISDTYMKVEPPLVALTNPGQALPPDMLSDPDHSSTKSGGDNASLPDSASTKDTTMDESDLKDPANPSNQGLTSPQNPNQSRLQEASGKQSKRSMLGNLIAKKPPPNLNASQSASEKEGRSGSVSGQGGLGPQGQGKPGEKDESEKEQGLSRRVRFAAFVAVEVRGRGQVLCRAPVYSF